MRIAVYHDLPSGGAKRTLGEMVRHLVGRHRVDVFTLSCADHEFADLRPFAGSHHVIPFTPLPLLNSPFGRFNQALRRADLFRLERLGAEIARQIDVGGYDVALVHPCQFEQAPSVLRYLRRTPSVYYCHEPRRSVHEPPPRRPYDDEAVGRRRLLNRLDPLPAVYRHHLRHVDWVNTRAAIRVLVNSRFTAEAATRIYGVTAEVCYHGVDVRRFVPLGLQKAAMVLSVGSLTPLKGFDFLIEAMAEYPGGKRPTLAIASNFGNPPERGYLERLARDRKVELVLYERVTDEQLVRLYNQARVVVYAPIREPFGLVPLEAMSCGTPVVAVAEGGIPESVADGRTGALLPRDPGRFASAVRELVEDPARAAALGANGRDHVRAHWTWERAARRLEAHLQAEAGKRPRRAPAMAMGAS